MRAYLNGKRMVFCSRGKHNATHITSILLMSAMNSSMVVMMWGLLNCLTHLAMSSTCELEV